MKLTNFLVVVIWAFLAQNTIAVIHKATTGQHQASIEQSVENQNQVQAQTQAQASASDETQASASDETQSQGIDSEKISDKDSIKAILSNKKGDFDESLFQNLLTTNDKLPHLLFSDVMTLTKKIA